MKKLLTVLIAVLVLLPHVSFAAMSSFDLQQQSDAVAFFQQQGKDRAEFIKDHSDIIAQQDQKVKEWKVQRDAETQQAKLRGDASSASPGTLPPITDPTLVAFLQKQQSDKQAFFAAQAQAKQKFLSSQ